MCTALASRETVILASTADQLNAMEAVVLKDNMSTLTAHQVIRVSIRRIDVKALIPVEVVEIWIIIEMPVTMLLVWVAFFDGR